MTSAHSLPLEGEWYTSTYHIAMTGYSDNRGNGSRAYEDSREVHISKPGSGSCFLFATIRELPADVN